nr:MAG TPA: hypothetical protein [Caudoviricetes sp.]
MFFNFIPHQKTPYIVLFKHIKSFLIQYVDKQKCLYYNIF